MKEIDSYEHNNSLSEIKIYLSTGIKCFNNCQFNKCHFILFNKNI